MLPDISQISHGPVKTLGIGTRRFCRFLSTRWMCFTSLYRFNRIPSAPGFQSFYHVHGLSDSSRFVVTQEDENLVSQNL